MDAKKCDRCGRFYEYYNGTEKFSKSCQSNTVELRDKHLNGGWIDRQMYDLCPECMEKLVNFLKNHFMMGID